MISRCRFDVATSARYVCSTTRPLIAKIACGFRLVKRPHRWDLYSIRAFDQSLRLAAASRQASVVVSALTPDLRSLNPPCSVSLLALSFRVFHQRNASISVVLMLRMGYGRRWSKDLGLCSAISSRGARRLDEAMRLSYAASI